MNIQNKHLRPIAPIIMNKVKATILITVDSWGNYCLGGRIKGQKDSRVHCHQIGDVKTVYLLEIDLKTPKQRGHSCCTIQKVRKLYEKRSND